MEGAPQGMEYCLRKNNDRVMEFNVKYIFLSRSYLLGLLSVHPTVGRL